MKELLLKQVQEIGLYKHITDILSSEKLILNGTQILGKHDSLPNIAASVCCQGAGLLTGISGSSDKFCCRETCVRCYRATSEEKTMTVVSGIVVGGNGEQGVDVLVTVSQNVASRCSHGSCGSFGMHPASSDILTALLLALPPHTWHGIRDKMLLEEVLSLVSVESLPSLLQEEVTHFRGQLLVLKRCNDNKKDSVQKSNDEGDDNELVWVDDRSQQTWEKYKRLKQILAEQEVKGLTDFPTDDNLWFEAVGGPNKKGEVYGMPYLSSKYSHTSVSFGSISSHVPPELIELRQQQQMLVQEQAETRRQLQEQQTETRRQLQEERVE